MNGGSLSANQNWRPFGKPLFDDPAARALSRIGVVDVGSNSVRMVVFDGAARSPAYFFNEKIMCALGSGLSETGRLNPEGRIRALAAIKRFQAIAAGMNIAPLSAVATAAVREAEDGSEFREEIAQETGLRLFIIDGLEEARLSAQGVLLGWPGAKGLVCDIGGSSMELAELAGGHVGQCLTSPLGPLKLRDIPGGHKGRLSHIKSVMADLHAQMPIDNMRLFLVGGSWRAIARLDMVRRDYPLAVLHEYRMTPKSLFKTINWIADFNQEELRAMTGIGEARMQLVPMASDVLFQLLRQFKPKEIAVSSYGLREGILYEQMPERLRHRDPLIEACRFAENKDARMPGFGKVLYKFVLPLFKSASDNRKRIIRAACLLHDVSWRAHPDYRAETCFDNATRANLGGLKHGERVFLGLALLHRYKNSRSGTRFNSLFHLLTEKQMSEAEVLGKAMRFGAMFAMRDLNDIAKLKFAPKKKQLELVLNKTGADFMGELTQARFDSLGRSLGVETLTRIKG